ncbi:transglutaminaseTgpA domain-containing protein [Leucobacter sp. USCH14]|uniref:transglutaminaseTgpA domain-containing protein n=1 Tax=Leucobacter sp. USCH14 TaxID=3024838 RepID=UPI003096BF22
MSAAAATTGGQRQSDAVDRAPAIRIFAAGGLLLVLWVLALAALTPVFVWGAWWPSALGIVAVTIVAACAMRARSPRRRVLAGFVGFAAGLTMWLLLLLFSGRIGDWVGDPVAVFEQVQLRIVGGSAPLTVAGPLTDLLLAIVLLVAAATTMLLVAADLPVFAGALVSLVLVVPSAVTGVSIGMPVWAAALAALGLLVWVSAGTPRWYGAAAGVVAGALAIGGMAVTPATQDRIWNDSLFPSPVSRTVPDVTLALAEDLRERSSAPAFSFTSSAPGPLRFTLATLAEFEGGQWQPQQELAAGRPDVTQARSAATLPPEPSEAAPSAPARSVTITIDGLLSSWLPLPQSTTLVHPSRDDDEFRAERWVWSAESNTAQTERDITRRGYEYTAAAAPLDAGQLPADGLASLPEEATALVTDADPGSAIARYLELPEGVPEAVSSAAVEAAGGRSSRLAVGRALQDWFRSSAFTYDEAAPYQPGADPGDPYAVMTEFLETRSGFCVHYAATFAVMARDLGAPTRVAVGYATRAERDERTVVLGRELHAWPEIYVDDVGWVAFEPTPGGAGLIADGDRPQRADQTDAPDPAAAPDDESAELPQPDEAPSEDPADAVTEGADPAEIAAAPTSAVGMWVVSTAAALLVLLVMCVPAARRAWRRRRRMRAIAVSPAPATAAWEELKDAVLDLGLGASSGVPVVPRAQTADALLEHWERAGALTGASALAAREIAADMTAERYGAAAPARDLRGDGERRLGIERRLVTCMTALRAAATSAQRIRARWMPRSVLRERGAASGTVARRTAAAD